jgi:predicted methyltransferase
MLLEHSGEGDSVATYDFKAGSTGDAMKNWSIFSLAFAVAAGIVGCGQRKEDAVTKSNNDKTVEQETKPVEQPKHGDHDHHHAFADPAERAKKWNDPERDKWQRPEEIVAALALKPGATVADIGAGTGYMVAHLSKAVGQGTVIAIDASAAMVEYLAKRSDDLGPGKIVAHQVGTDDPELQPASVDGVLTLDTWHHVKGREAYARKVYEALKPGGRFVVVEYDVDAEVGPPKAMRFEPGQVTKQLEAAGFRAEVVRESMPRHYMVVGHKD